MFQLFKTIRNTVKRSLLERQRYPQPKEPLLEGACFKGKGIRNPKNPFQKELASKAKAPATPHVASRLHDKVWCLSELFLSSRA